MIHIGANTGQERGLYRHHGLRALWIEPIPEVFETLVANLRDCPGQAALCSLVTDRDDVEYPFHVSSNAAASSSILELKLHRDVWPEVTYSRTIQLRGVTLATLIEKERISLDGYDALVLDTQGSELLVLRGAEPILSAFRFVKAEAADFEAYAGCCQLPEIASFLEERGFREISRRRFAERAGGGSYYDVVFERRTWPVTDAEPRPRR